MVKLFAWEQLLAERVRVVRRDELRQRHKASTYD